MSSASEYYLNVAQSGTDVTSLVAQVENDSYLHDIYGKGIQTQCLKLPNGKTVTVAKIEKDMQRIGDCQEMIINGVRQLRITEDVDYVNFIANLLSVVGEERILKATELLGQRSSTALTEKILEEFEHQFPEVKGKPMFETALIKDQSVILTTHEQQCFIVRKIWGSFNRYTPTPTDGNELPTPESLENPVFYSGDAAFDLIHETKEYLISLIKKT